MVRDMNSAIKKLKSTGATVVSTRGESLMMNGTPYAIVRDLNNFFLVLRQPASQTTRNP